MDEPTKQELARLVQLDEADLLLELAKGLPPEPSLAVESEDPAEKRRVARNWLRIHFPEIRKRVCASKQIRNYLSQPGAFDRVTTAAAVLDAIMSATLSHIPAPFVVAALISREGLKALCDGVDVT